MVIIYQYFPFPVRPKHTQIGDFWYQNKPSGSPGRIVSNVKTALKEDIRSFVCSNTFANSEILLLPLVCGYPGKKALSRFFSARISMQKNDSAIFCFRPWQQGPMHDFKKLFSPKNWAKNWRF
jgi:hypothetical protein